VFVEVAVISRQRGGLCSKKELVVSTAVELMTSQCPEHTGSKIFQLLLDKRNVVLFLIPYKEVVRMSEKNS